MKKYFSAVLLTSLLFSVAPLVHAATTVTKTVIVKNQVATPTASPATASTTVTVKEEYVLPYPGILPDHPLYFLKQIRDWLLDRLIVDGVRKVEFYILQGDKRLGMGIMLFDQKKGDLAEQTISKGEKYLDKALTATAALKNNGKEIPGDVLDRLNKSIAKHIEVLEDLLTKVNDDQKSGIRGSLDLVKKLQLDVAKLK